VKCPADLINRGTIERAAITRAGDGGEVKAWQALATTSAAIDTKGGKEFYRARQVNAELTHELTIWYQDVQPSDRFKYVDPKSNATRYFDIQAVVNPSNEQRHMLLLHCRELVGREVNT
jgi:SPP1 family predicted phage head-tail adaptor